ncbi:hypothetical protein L1887_55734 [Cichorium endivia]|nr:hypothetical protein L1887_55734 [Cichorium endivia]
MRAIGRLTRRARFLKGSDFGPLEIASGCSSPHSSRRPHRPQSRTVHMRMVEPDTSGLGGYRARSVEWNATYSGAKGLLAEHSGAETLLALLLLLLLGCCECAGDGDAAAVRPILPPDPRRCRVGGLPDGCGRVHPPRRRPPPLGLAPPRESEEAAKEDVLCDGQLLEHLCAVHLDHALVDLGPGFCARDVVEHGRVPAERGGLDRVDKLNAGEVHVLGSELVDDLGVVDGPWDADGGGC